MESSRIIVLGLRPYADNGIILTTLSESEGFLTLISTSSRGSRSKLRFNAYCYPLAQLSASYRIPSKKQDLARLIDIEDVTTLNSLRTDPRRMAIAFYICELTSKALRAQPGGEELFFFLQEASTRLNEDDANIPLFAQAYSLALACRLGYAPLGECDAATPLFSINEGTFCEPFAFDPSMLDANLSSMLFRLLLDGYDASSESFPHAQRGELLRALILYLSTHLGVEITLKSLPVLEDLFR